MFGTIGRVARPVKASLWRRVLGLCLLCTAAGPGWANTKADEFRAFYEKAVEHTDLGQIRSAVIEPKNTLQRDPENAEARLMLAASTF